MGKMAILGTILILIHMIVANLSHQFVFGENYQQRPIIAFTLLMGLAGIIYIFSVEAVRQNPGLFSHPTVIMLICAAALLMRLVYSSSNLIQETDPYRYIWDGQAVLQGVNPFQHSPQEAVEHGFKPASREAIVQDVYRKINHKGVKTIYPPLAQGLFAISQCLTPWKITGWRWMVALADCATIGLLIAILGRMGIPKTWVVVYAWSPLVIKEFSNSVHLDVFALLMLSLMSYALVRGWLTAAYLCLAGAVLIKLFPMVLLPVLVFWQFDSQKKALPKNLFIFFSVLFLAYLPFLQAGAFLTEGLSRFMSEWQTNEGIFGLIRWAVSFLALDGRAQAFISRAISGGLFVAGLAAVLSWLRNKNDIQSLMKALAITLAILFFILPTGFPWYYTWIVLFIPFLPLRALILFSVLGMAYYLDFYFTYHEARPMFGLVRWVEYGLFYFILGIELWCRRLPSLSRS